MPKLTIEDLKRIKEEVRSTTVLREGGFRAKVNVHMGTCGIAAGARKLMSAVLKEIEEKKITDVMVTTSGCAASAAGNPWPPWKSSDNLLSNTVTSMKKK